MDIAHKRGHWSAQRPYDISTIWECSRTALSIARYYKRNIPEDKIWDLRDKNANATIGIALQMFERASGKKCSITLQNTKQVLSRSDLAVLSVLF